jgi:hypothetical protein
VLILKIIFFLKKHHFNIKNILKNNYNYILKQDKKNEKDGEKKKRKKKKEVIKNGSHAMNPMKVKEEHAAIPV